MKLYKKYREIINEIKPIKLAWFTTFNLDPELTEKFLVSYLTGTEPSELKTAEDYEALNIDLAGIDVKVWYDYRALNLNSPKRTCIDFIPVNPANSLKGKSSSSIFHPKVIFLKGENGAYLITGSANLSISAWSSNKESVLIKQIVTKENAKQVVDFFKQLGARNRNLTMWLNSLPDEQSSWDFVDSFKSSFNLFEYLKGDELIIWAPYFSKHTRQLFDQILSLGYENITLVPNVDENGKISIGVDEIKTLLEDQKISIKRPVRIDEQQGLHHAKVWLTESRLAVGSWNCSHRATGLKINSKETNIEAGIVVNVNQSDITLRLHSTITDFDKKENIEGQTEKELTEQWEKVLNDFKISVEIIADWESFTYSTQLNEKLENGNYFVVLPHNTTEKISLNEVNGLSFRKSHIKVLKNKTFLVYDENNKPVFNGYLQEVGKEKRPVYSYVSLSDLFESLITNLENGTEKKTCRYKLTAEDDESTGTTNVQTEGWNKIKYEGSETFYLMFVAFQRLHDKIVGVKGNPVELDRIGYRLPGSLLNIKCLIKETVSDVPDTKDEDNLIYYFFLIMEVNRCIDVFNKCYDEKIEKVSIAEIAKQIRLRKKDKKFLNSLKKEFGYETV